MIKNIKELKIGDLMNFGDKAELVQSIKILFSDDYYTIVNGTYAFKANSNVVTW